MGVSAESDNKRAMLSTHFEELGFLPKEQQVYLALLELGKSSVTSLSKRTKIPRATLYTVLESLTEKGVVSKEPLRGSRLFVASGTSSLKRMVEREKERIASRENAAQELAQLLSKNLSTGKYSPPKLQFFEGKKSIENMLYDSLPVWRESYMRTANGTLWGYQDQTFVEAYRRWHNYMWETRSAKEYICLFSNPADIEKELKHKIQNREVRLLPKGAQFSSSVWIYGEYIVMGMTRDEPHYAYQLRDPFLAANLRAVFELLWSTAERGFGRGN